MNTNNQCFVNENINRGYKYLVIVSDSNHKFTENDITIIQNILIDILTVWQTHFTTKQWENQ